MKGAVAKHLISALDSKRGGALRYILGKYVLPGTQNLGPVLKKKNCPKIDTPL